MKIPGCTCCSVVVVRSVSPIIAVNAVSQSLSEWERWGSRVPIADWTGADLALLQRGRHEGALWRRPRPWRREFQSSVSMLSVLRRLYASMTHMCAHQGHTLQGLANKYGPDMCGTEDGEASCYQARAFLIASLVYSKNAVVCCQLTR